MVLPILRFALQFINHPGNKFHNKRLPVFQTLSGLLTCQRPRDLSALTNYPQILNS